MHSLSSTTLFFGSALLGAMLLIPLAVSADTATARLGGGNALLRVTIGQSQGIIHTSAASNLFDNLTLASARGGQPDPVPANENSNSGGTTSTDQSDGAQGSNAATQQGDGSASNGGASAGNGGNGGNGGGGGDAGPGGLVRAGNTVSNATAINAINTSIVRITIR